MTHIQTELALISKRPRRALTFEEKVKAAYLHFYHGVDQHTIAELVFDGINQGRINEACVKVEKALKENGRTHK